MQISARTADNDTIHFVIGDTGDGIPEATQHQIFNPYYTTKPKGTGLGLAIVHKIVASHGGRISVQSKPGEGARFHIVLPLSATVDCVSENPSME